MNRIDHPPPENRHETADHAYGLLGGIIIGCILLAALLIALDYGVPRPGPVFLPALALIDLAVAVALVYTLRTVGHEIGSDGATRRPYGRLGLLVIVVIVGALLVGLLAAASIPVALARGLFAALGASGLVLSAGCVYLLLTLETGLDPATERRPRYPAAARLVVAALLLSAGTAAVAGPVAAWLGSAAALTALVLLRIGFGLALAYALFVLNDSIAEVRFQRRVHRRTTAGPPLDIHGDEPTTTARGS